MVRAHHGRNPAGLGRREQLQEHRRDGHRRGAGAQAGADEVLAVHAPHHSAVASGTAETQLRVRGHPQQRAEPRPPDRVLRPADFALLEFADVVAVQLGPLAPGVLEQPRVDQISQLLPGQVVPAGILPLSSP